jgi:hypothetical protein
MTSLKPYDIWRRRVHLLVPRQRSEAVRIVANACEPFWLGCWSEGLSPRAAMARLRNLWS